MTHISVICENKECKNTFPSELNFVNCQNVKFQNCASGTCPKCGSLGMIPNGVYNAINNNVFAFLQDSSDIEVLRKVADTLKKNIKNKKSPNKIRRELIKEYSQFKSTWNLMPRNKDEAYKFVNILLGSVVAACAILTVMNSTDESKPKTIINETTINNTINNHDQSIHVLHQNILDDNHTEGNTTQDNQRII